MARPANLSSGENQHYNVVFGGVIEIRGVIDLRGPQRVDTATEYWLCRLIVTGCRPPLIAPAADKQDLHNQEKRKHCKQPVHGQALAVRMTGTQGYSWAGYSSL